MAFGSSKTTANNCFLNCVFPSLWLASFYSYRLGLTASSKATWWLYSISECSRNMFFNKWLPIYRFTPQQRVCQRVWGSCFSVTAIPEEVCSACLLLRLTRCSNSKNIFSCSVPFKHSSRRQLCFSKQQPYLICFLSPLCYNRTFTFFLSF